MIAIIVSGCLVKGIINISGRISDYDGIYLVMGVLFLAFSIISIIKDLIKNK